MRVEDLPEIVTNTRGQQRPSTYKPRVDTETGEVSDGQSHASTTAAPTTKQRRKPIAESSRAAGWKLRSALDDLIEIAGDDRFEASQETVAPHLRSHLEKAIDVCQDILARLDKKESTE